MAADPAARDAAAPVRWEERAEARVLEGARERMLARSRRLVRAAAELVAAEGIDALTLRAVLERTGLSRRAFYERFDGKDDLLLAVFEETLREAADVMRERLGASDDPLERLRLVIEQMICGAHSDERMGYGMAMSREHLRLAESRPRELRQALEPLTKLMAEQLEAGMERGRVRRADPHALAVMIHNLVAATIHSALLAGPQRRDRARASAETAAAVWEFCRRAVAA